MAEKRQPLELQANRVRYYSPSDEEAFFAWLDKIPCVEDRHGRGDTLRIFVNAAAVDEQGLRELIALFYRYEIDQRQLAAFDRSEFAPWFRDKGSYWHKGVFG